MIGWILDLIVLVIAFSISPIVGFVWLIINVVYIIVRNQNVKTVAAHVERTALSVFEWEKYDKYFSFSIQVSFPDMLMLTHNSCSDYPGWSKYRLFQVKRDTITGKWYIKHTSESQQKELCAIRAKEAGRPLYTQEDKEKEEEEVYKNEWVEITDMYPQLEANYQKWLHDGGRNDLAPVMERLLSNPDK